MEKLDTEQEGYSYYGYVTSCVSRIVIKPDRTRPVAWIMNYHDITLPLDSYKDEDVKLYKGQRVYVQAHFNPSKWNPDLEVYDAENYERKMRK